MAGCGEVEGPPSAPRASPARPSPPPRVSYPYFDTHIHSTQYYCVQRTGDPATLFSAIAADRILLFGSYPNVVNGYSVEEGVNEDDVSLRAYRLFPDRVSVAIMGYTPDHSDEFMRYLETHMGEGVVGLGEYGFGVQECKCMPGKREARAYRLDYPSLEQVPSLTRMLEFAKKHRLIVFLHTQDFADPRRQLDWSVLDSYPTVQFLAPHIAQFMGGNPRFQEEVEARLAHCNLFLELRVTEYLDDVGTPNWRQGWAHLLRTYPDRFTIGSDSQPSSTKGSADMGWTLSSFFLRDFLSAFGLSEDETWQIMYGNAARLVDERRTFRCGSD